MAPPKRVRLALHIPKTVQGVLALDRTVSSSIGANADVFITPNPTVAVMIAHGDALEAAEIATKTVPRGTVHARDLALGVCVVDLQTQGAYVQFLMDTHPGQELIILGKSGFGARKEPAPRVNEFTATKGLLSNTVDLHVPAAPRAISYDWQMSLDGHTWIDLPHTAQVHTTVPGLTAGTTYYFRYRVLTRKGLGDWSQPLPYIAH